MIFFIFCEVLVFQISAEPRRKSLNRTSIQNDLGPGQSVVKIPQNLVDISLLCMVNRLQIPECCFLYWFIPI